MYGGWGWGWYSCWESSSGCHGDVSKEGQVGCNEEQDTVKQLTQVLHASSGFQLLWAVWWSLNYQQLLTRSLSCLLQQPTAVLSFLFHIQMQTAVLSFFTIVSSGSFCLKHMDTCSKRNFIFSCGEIPDRFQKAEWMRERGSERWSDVGGVCVATLEGGQGTSSSFSYAA